MEEEKEEGKVLNFDPIKGKRVQGIEDLLTLVVGEASKNSVVEKIIRELNRRIDKINNDPKLRKEYIVALGVYVPVLNSLVEESKDCDERFRRRIKIKLGKYMPPEKDK